MPTNIKATKVSLGSNEYKEKQLLKLTNKNALKTIVTKTIRDYLLAVAVKKITTRSFIWCLDRHWCNWYFNFSIFVFKEPASLNPKTEINPLDFLV